MRIFIYARQHEISQIISDHLSEKGNLCFAFANQPDVSMAVRNQKKLPDLMILDYTLYNHDILLSSCSMKHINLLITLQQQNNISSTMTITNTLNIYVICFYLYDYVEFN